SRVQREGPNSGYNDTYIRAAYKKLRGVGCSNLRYGRGECLVWWSETTT
ncbi:unnamed protein product, partial [Musa acuminata subsp. burmannicoides]